MRRLHFSHSPQSFLLQVCGALQLGLLNKNTSTVDCTAAETERTIQYSYCVLLLCCFFPCFLLCTTLMCLFGVHKKRTLIGTDLRDVLFVVTLTSPIPLCWGIKFLSLKYIRVMSPFTVVAIFVDCVCVCVLIFLLSQVSKKLKTAEVSSTSHVLGWQPSMWFFFFSSPKHLP